MKMPISLHVAEKIESKHMPVEPFIGLKNERSEQSRKTPKTFKVEKYICVTIKSDDFTTCLRSDQTKTCFTEALELVEADVNSCIKKLNDGLGTAG